MAGKGKILFMSNKYKGILLILGSAFCFTFMNAFVRLAGELPFVQKSFFRNIVALIFALVVLLKNRISLRPQNKSNLKFLIIRSICGTVGVLCNFYAVDHLVLSDASMLNKMSPFFVIIFSYIFLREKTTVLQALGIVAAFLGALLIIKPSFNLTEFLPSLVGFLGGVGAGAAYTTTRYLGNNGEKGSYIVFFFSLFSCIIILPVVILDFVPMSLQQVCMLLLAGLFAAGGQFCITGAYKFAPGKEISVYDYSQVVFSALLGFVLFSQIPDSLSIMGYVIIFAVAVLMFLYNNFYQSKRHNSE